MNPLTIQYTYRQTWTATICNGRFTSRIECLSTREDTEASVIDLLLDMGRYGYIYGCCTVLPDVIDCMPDDAVMGYMKEWDVI